jgi:DNA-directed RNA polymerase subunit RPC12/RpoP
VLALRSLEPFHGEEPPLRITVHGMPALDCGKHRYFVKPDFPLWLMDHLVGEEAPALPAGDPTGLLFRSYVCHGCGKALQPQHDRVHSFDLDLAYPGQPAFRVQLAMPAFRCGGCGKEQVHSLAEVRRLTPAALVRAFRSAAVKAPG